MSVLEREFTVFVRNLHRNRQQVNGSPLEKMALMVLGTLSSCGPSRQTTIAERTCFDPSTVSRQVADLEKAGLLTREPDPEDRRAVLLQATTKGHALMARLSAGRRKRFDRMLSDWTANDIREFGRLLGMLNEASEKYSDQNALELEQELNHD